MGAENGTVRGLLYPRSPARRARSTRRRALSMRTFQPAGNVKEDDTTASPGVAVPAPLRGSGGRSLNVMRSRKAPRRTTCSAPWFCHGPDAMLPFSATALQKPWRHPAGHPEPGPRPPRTRDCHPPQNTARDRKRGARGSHWPRSAVVGHLHLGAHFALNEQEMPGAGCAGLPVRVHARRHERLWQVRARPHPLSPGAQRQEVRPAHRHQHLLHGNRPERGPPRKLNILPFPVRGEVTHLTSACDNCHIPRWEGVKFEV